MTRDEATRRLLDLEAIKQLKGAYCRLLDTKQWDAWRLLFTEDAVFEGTTAPGDDRDSFVAAVRAGLDPMTTVHQVHQPEIVFTASDNARGLWAFFDYLDWSGRANYGAGVEGQWGLLGYGHYEEEYRRVEAEWKIARMRLTRLRVDALVGERPPALPFKDAASIDWLSKSRPEEA